MTNTPRRSAFDEFDGFHARWRTANPVDRAGLVSQAGPLVTMQMISDLVDCAGLVDEAVALGERLVAETDATGQGTEFALVAALTHLATVTEVGDDTDLLDAADALVSEMNALVNG